MASVNRGTDKWLAHQRFVTAEVASKADEIGDRAKSRLAPHRGTGTAEVVVTHGRVDSLVELVDPAALSIEFGRGSFTTKSGRTVGPMQGLHIVTGAI